MANRVGLILLLVLGILASSGCSIAIVSATGDGSSVSPFIVHELTMDARFVSEGSDGQLIINENLVGQSNEGGNFSQDNVHINEGANTIILFSNFDSDLCEKVDCYINVWGVTVHCKNKCDECGFKFYNDHVLAVFRIGSDTDNNVIYTQAAGWDAGGHTINEASINNCYFNDLEWGYDLSSWTDQEKCVNTESCGNNCCETQLSRTFYVKKCECTTQGPCCDGCNYKSGACSDGNPCTLNDYCSAGACISGPQKDCSSSGDQCNTGICNTVTGGCVKQPKAGSCDDGQFCTINDYCSGGQCLAGPARDCTSLSDQCNTGMCSETSDQCVKQPRTGSCDDGLFCTINDYCSGGSCAGYSRDCSFVSDQCNTGVCSETSDQCAKQPRTGSCTTPQGYPGTCSSGTCIPLPLLSVSAYFDPKSAISVGEQTTLKGTAACSNAYCNYVKVYALDKTSGKLINDIANLYVQGSNPYECGGMYPGEACYPSWIIRGNYPGSYQIFLRANNTLQGGVSGDSTTLTLTVNEIPAGTLSPTISAEPSTLTAGSTANVKATIYCYGEANSYCGNITSYLFYNGIRMSGSGNLSTSSPNPSSSCRDLWNGGTCDIAWQVNATGTGTYTLSVTAASDYHTATNNVNNATAQTQLVVNSRPVGVLSFEGLYMNPESQSIVLGGTARFGANVKCTSSAPSNPLVVSCGTVKAYPTYDGNKINQLGGSLSVITTERDCGTMYSSSNPCPVNWTITGKSLGSYTLAVIANSSSSETQNITSDKKMLEVAKNLGYLSIPWVEIKPDKMNLTSPPSTAKLSVTLNCSTNDCGKVNVTLWIEGQMLDSGTNVSTHQNLQSCSSFPCNLSWTLSGNSEGSFEINIRASSNETHIPGVGKTAKLDVIDPRKPMLSLSTNLESISATATQIVQINANVACLVKDCGQTELSLAYNANGWKNLPYGSVLLQSENLKYMNLFAGQSNDAAWNVNFTQAGTYELRIAATGSAPNITNSEKKANITVSNIRGNIQILSPKPNQKFLRGDSVFLKANITADEKPMAGLSPLVQELNAMLYDDGKHDDGSANDGIYAGNGMVPSDAYGSYSLMFMSEGFENSTYIYVNPNLYVAVNAGKGTYSWGEIISISGDVRREENGEKTPANVTLAFTHEKDSNWKYEVVLSAATGHFSYNYSNLDTPNKNGTLRISASAKDNFANSGQGSAGTSIKAAEGVHEITFLMNKSNYRRGENMTIITKPKLVTKAGSIRKMNCTLSGSATKTLGEMDGTYYGNYMIPTDIELGKRTLSCSFAGEESGTGYTNITIEPMVLNISVITPYDSRYNVVPVVSTESVELKVGVFYPDNSPVTDGTVEINVAGKIINMTRTGVPGIYSASGLIFTKEHSGTAMSSMIMTAQDLHDNIGRNEVNVIVDSGQFNWWWLLLIPAGMVVLFILWYYEKSREPPKIQIQEKIIKLPGERVREVQRVREVVYRPVAIPQKRADPAARLEIELSRLEEKQRTITNAKDLAEQQYYKRQIDEATFNKLMQSYEEKLIEIDAAIRQKRKELSGMEPG